MINFNDFLTEGVQDKGLFKAIFMCGHPGSGKSYVLKKIGSGQMPVRMVNVDRFEEQFGWKGETTKQLSKNQLALFINSMLPLFVDGTSANRSALLLRKGILESLGYDTGMVFVNCSLQTALDRAAKRKRYVPPDFIRDAYKRVQGMKPFFKSTFHNFFVEVDNGIGELTDKVILAAYKKADRFFSTPLRNPIGQEHIETLIASKGKYLYDGIYSKDELADYVTRWYRKK